MMNRVNKMVKKVLTFYKKYEEIINYLIVGGLTTIINLLVYYIFAFFLEPSHPILLQIDNIIAWIISIIFAYFTNRKYVFKSRNMHLKKEFISFTGSRIITLLLDMFIMFLLVTNFHINDKISKIFSQILVIIGNYILSKFFVFKKGIN